MPWLFAHATLAPDVSVNGPAKPFQIEVTTEDESWWFYAASGVASLAIGALVLAYPDPSVRLIGVFLGVDLLIAAVALIIRGVSTLSPEGAGQNELLLGILALITGVVVIRNPGETVVLLAVALAVYLIVAGALALGRGIVSPEDRALSFAKALLLIAGGTLIIAWPQISLGTFVLLSGIALCLVGAADIGEAFVARSRRRRVT